MRISQITVHIAQQNWLALILDFIIVVAGVFLGIQLGNWNAARADDIAFTAALEQLHEEIEANRELVAAYSATYEQRFTIVQNAIEAMQECDAARETEINLALQILRSTPGFYPRMAAVHDLTEDDAMKRLQTPQQRQSIQELRRILERVDEGSGFLEAIPFETPIEQNPLIRYDESGEDTFMPGQLVRDIRLAVPVSEACTDESLKKKFYEYERVSHFTQILANLADTALNEAETSLGL